VLILVRHGRTGFNAAGRLVGRLDPPLDDLGLTQASAIGAALKGVERVVSSPLLRARQTAESIGVPVEIDDRWIEVDYGALDEQPLGSVAGEVWDRWRTDSTYVPAGGESFVDVAERVSAACEALAADAMAGNVVVVSHVSPIKAAVAWALGVGPEISWRMHLDVAAITRIHVGTGGASLHSFNETGHLAGVSRQAAP